MHWSHTSMHNTLLTIHISIRKYLKNEPLWQHLNVDIQKYIPQWLCKIYTLFCKAITDTRSQGLAVLLSGGQAQKSRRHPIVIQMGQILASYTLYVYCSLNAEHHRSVVTNSLLLNQTRHTCFLSVSLLCFLWMKTRWRTFVTRGYDTKERH